MLDSARWYTVIPNQIQIWPVYSWECKCKPETEAWVLMRGTMTMRGTRVVTHVMQKSSVCVAELVEVSFSMSLSSPPTHPEKTQWIQQRTTTVTREAEKIGQFSSFKTWKYNRQSLPEAKAVASSTDARARAGGPLFFSSQETIVSSPAMMLYTLHPCPPTKAVILLLHDFNVNKMQNLNTIGAYISCSHSHYLPLSCA